MTQARYAELSYLIKSLRGASLFVLLGTDLCTGLFERPAATCWPTTSRSTNSTRPARVACRDALPASRTAGPRASRRRPGRPPQTGGRRRVSRRAGQLVPGTYLLPAVFLFPRSCGARLVYLGAATSGGAASEAIRVRPP